MYLGYRTHYSYNQEADKYEMGNKPQEVWIKIPISKNL